MAGTVSADIADIRSGLCMGFRTDDSPCDFASRPQRFYSWESALALENLTGALVEMAFQPSRRLALVVNVV